jgi:hypothetical protein
MGNDMYQDELEQFLQDEVKDHRMYPSDKIWRNINAEVNGHQRWPALSFISLFIISALTVSTLLNINPSQKLLKANSLRQTGPQKQPLQDLKHTLNDFNSTAPSDLTANTIANLKRKSNPLEPELSEIEETPVVAMNFSNRVEPISVMKNRLDKHPSKPAFLQEPAIVVPMGSLASRELSPEKINFLTEMNEQATMSAGNTKPTVEEHQTNDQASKITEPASSNAVKEQAATDVFLQDFAYVPPTRIEQRKNSKFGFGFFITPSTSYRRLTDDKAKDLLGEAPASAPVGLNYTTDINSIVRHKPAVGLELGFAVLYNMSKRLKFKTGIQFNTRQYHIETFQASTDITTISLVNNRGVENISMFSPYNNNNGYKSTQLDNKMYQVSIPIGFQYDVIQGRKLGITAEASIQPTFTLNKSLYLLSTDYKHYADGNNLMRKWNINSAVGINLTYKTGAYQWYLGPQARFQHLPTYSNKYPITEYLMDYGIRLGFIKQLK